MNISIDHARTVLLLDSRLHTQGSRWEAVITDIASQVQVLQDGNDDIDWGGLRVVVLAPDGQPTRRLLVQAKGPSEALVSSRSFSFGQVLEQSDSVRTFLERSSETAACNPCPEMVDMLSELFQEHDRMPMTIVVMLSQLNPTRAQFLAEIICMATQHVFGPRELRFTFVQVGDDAVTAGLLEQFTHLHEPQVETSIVIDSAPASDEDDEVQQKAPAASAENEASPPAAAESPVPAMSTREQALLKAACILATAPDVPPAVDAQASAASSPESIAERPVVPALIWREPAKFNLVWVHQVKETD
jgi:hypothetical protein